MMSIDQKIARTTGSLPPFLQRKIKFVEAVADDSAGRSQISYNQNKKRSGPDAVESVTQTKGKFLFDKGIVDNGMTWKNVHHIGPGLSNLGNTCFLNSVLQCLIYSAPFTNILLQRLHGKQCQVEGFCIICEMEKHAHISFDGRQKRRHIGPNGVVANIKLIGKQFRLGRQEDAHEFLRYFIESMQKVCLFGFDPKMENRFKESSMIHAVFGGYLQSKVTCHTCKHESSVYEPLLDLSLEVKSANTVHSALRQFTTAEILSKENRYRCDSCKKLTDASKQFKVHDTPNILTIHLKRFQMFPAGMVKIHRDVEFTSELDISPFLSNPEDKVIYDLYAVLVHEGQSCNSGHYHCFVKNSNGIWYSMNDESVHQVSLATVLKQKAYILFYQKRITKRPVPNESAHKKQRTTDDENQQKIDGNRQSIDESKQKTDESKQKTANKEQRAKQESSQKGSPNQAKSGHDEREPVVEEDDISLDDIVSKSMWHLKRFIKNCTPSSSRVFPSWKVTQLGSPKKK